MSVGLQSGCSGGMTSASGRLQGAWRYAAHAERRAEQKSKTAAAAVHGNLK